jgi:ABC-type phosphate transport system substrate-binding protein
MATRFLGILVALLVLAPTSLVGQPSRTEGRVAVIVHPERSMTLSQEEIAQIYLRRKRFWSEGAVIVPLNLPSQAPLREHFSQLILKQTEPRLADYWNRLYFAGILPPATLASTEAVRRYVASDPNAIGYVPAAEVDESVRVVFYLD